MDKAYPVTRPEKSAGVMAVLVITRDALTIELIKAMHGTVSLYQHRDHG